MMLFEDYVGGCVSFDALIVVVIGDSRLFA